MAMPTSFVEAKLEFKAAAEGAPDTRRWSNCIVQIMQLVPMPLGLLFVDAKFDESSKQVVRLRF